jgi:hypothetical protein
MLIKLNCGENAEEEWCILEFQGELLGDLACSAEVGEILEIKVCITPALSPHLRHPLHIAPHTLLTTLFYCVSTTGK